MFLPAFKNSLYICPAIGLGTAKVGNACYIWILEDQGCKCVFKIICWLNHSYCLNVPLMNSLVNLFAAQRYCNRF